MYYLFVFNVKQQAVLIAPSILTFDSLSTCVVSICDSPYKTRLHEPFYTRTLKRYKLVVVIVFDIINNNVKCFKIEISNIYGEMDSLIMAKRKSIPLPSRVGQSQIRFTVRTHTVTQSPELHLQE